MFAQPVARHGVHLLISTESLRRRPKLANSAITRNKLARVSSNYCPNTRRDESHRQRSLTPLINAAHNASQLINGAIPQRSSLATRGLSN